MFGVLQLSGQPSHSNDIPNNTRMNNSDFSTSSTKQINKRRKPSSTSTSPTYYRQESPINLPQYPPMPRPIRDERQLAPLPCESLQLQPNLSLSCLADTALASTATSITLPPISSLITSDPAANDTFPTTFLPPSSGSTAVSVSTFPHTPSVRSHSPKSAFKSDQPGIDINGWSNTSSETASNTHMPINNPFPPKRPSRKDKQKKSNTQARPSSHNVQLEYDVRSYTRVANVHATPPNPSGSSITAPAPTRTQPTRSSRMQLPHPLQGLTLDKTYPERKVEDWHNDAQKLLRLPVPRPDLGSSTSTDNINQHTTAQALNPPKPVKQNATRKIHPPADAWDNHPLPQIQSDHLYLPQTQPTSSYPRPAIRRHQSSSSLSGANWNDIYSNNPSPQSTSYTFIPEHPELSTQSRHRNVRISNPTPYSMQRSRSAHSSDTQSRKVYNQTISEPSSPQKTKEVKMGGSLPTPMTGSMDCHWQSEEATASDNGRPTSHNATIPTYQPEVLSLPQVQQVTPPLPVSSLLHQKAPLQTGNSPRPLITPNLVPTREVSPIDQEMQGDSSFQRAVSSYDKSHGSSSSQMNIEPDLESGESSESESGSEPASDDGDGHPSSKIKSHDTRLRIRIPKSSNVNNQRDHTMSSPSSKSSLRARSSSHSSENTDLVKYEPSSSPTTSCFSPDKSETKRQRTRNKTKSTSDNSQSSENCGSKDGSVEGGSIRKGRGQRRNGERRREQNAVAQKKFRWKKKQMAAKMEADLESANALASSLKKEVAEKNQLVNKLKGEVGSLKRKLKTLEA